MGHGSLVAGYNAMKYLFLRELKAVVMMFFALTFSAAAAEIELFDTGQAAKMIFINGPIAQGDSDRFYEISEDLQRALIVLRSSGGIISEALQIGAEIKLRGFATYVPPGIRCMSACALIWISGERRRLSDGSVVGFHAAYVKDTTGRPRETGMGNAEVGSFLTHLGLPVEAIRFVTAAAPSDFKLLTPEVARTVGIDVIVNNGDADVAIPSAHTLARRAGDLTGMEIACSSVFGVEKGWFEEVAANTIKAGHDIVGGSKFGELISIVVEQTKPSWQKRDSDFEWCVNTAWRLASDRVNPFPPGPSYDCGKASQPAERMICEDDQLSAADRIVAAMYAYYKAVPEPELVEWVKSTQRAWLKGRNSCDNDRDCMMQAYDQRIGALLP
jgi:uncharacterized protein YecT (DUF1311 family)